MGRKGGIRSGQARRKKAQARKTAELMAKMLLESEEVKKLLDEMKKRLR